MHATTTLGPASQRGSISVAATFLALVVAGMAVALIGAGFASRRIHARSDGSLYALEAAETGIARAEQEVASQTDPGADGIGNVSGTYAGSGFTVTATQDATITERWRLLARGWRGQTTRRIEVCVRRIPGGVWNYAVVGKNSINLSGSSVADSYDSRLGTYASQATNSDSLGAYALSGGAIASNGNITLSGAHVHGDATPGPGNTITLSGGAAVSGSTAQMA